MSDKDNNKTNNKAIFSKLISGTEQGKTRCIKTDDDGNKEIVKKSDVNPTSWGKGVILECTPEQFVEQLKNAGLRTCFVYGIPSVDEFRYSSEAYVEQHKDDVTDSNLPLIARLKKVFTHTEKVPGVMCIDFDPHSMNMNQDEFRDAMLMALPELNSSPYVMTYSSSSFLEYGKEGDEDYLTTGSTGQRMYIFVDDISFIPDTFEYLNDKFYLLDLSGKRISDGCQIIEDSIVDLAFKSSNNLDFVGGSILEDGLTQNIPEPKIFNADADFLKLANIKPLDEDEHVAVLDKKLEWKKKLEPRRREMVAAKSKAMANKYGGGNDEKTKLLISGFYRAYDKGELFSDMPIKLQNGKEITVHDLLENQKYHKANMYDPLDWGYMGGNKSNVAVFFYYVANNGDPFIYSQAHSGIYYKLLRHAKTVDLKGDNLSKCIDICIETGLSTHPNVFVYSRGITQIVNNEECDAYIDDMSVESMAYTLDGMYNFRKYDGRSQMMKPCNCPVDLARSILKLNTKWGVVKHLDGIIDMPIIDLNGNIHSNVGYYSALKLFNHNIDCKSFDCEDVTDQQMIDAYDVMMQPFSDYKFADEDTGESLSALVSNILSAPIRSVIDIAPGNVVTSPVASSGKTYMIRTMSIVHTGEEHISKSLEDQPKELGLFLDTQILKGSTFIGFDNLPRGHHIDNPHMNMFITAKDYKSRKLGNNAEIKGKNKTTVCYSLNAGGAKGDALERFFVIRLDPKVKEPTKVKHEFVPMVEAKKHRRRIIESGIVILKGMFERLGDVDERSHKEGKFVEFSLTVGAAINILRPLLLKDRGLVLADVNEMLSRVKDDITVDFENEFMLYLKDVKGGNHFSAEELCTLVNKEGGGNLLGAGYSHTEIVDVTSTRKCVLDLSKIVDKPIGDFKLVQYGRGKPKRFVLTEYVGDEWVAIGK